MLTMEKPIARLASVDVPSVIDRRGIRPREIARTLGVAPNVVYAAIYSGELKSWRFGRAIVVPTDALEDWLRSKAA
ncbi:MAG: helix-turn-helix domain-containing protein [Thermomicrobiales bacterium]